MIYFFNIFSRGTFWGSKQEIKKSSKSDKMYRKRDFYITII